jgi:hypothetical protein
MQIGIRGTRVYPAIHWNKEEKKPGILSMAEEGEMDTGTLNGLKTGV